jgi:hypothetical protein
MHWPSTVVSQKTRNALRSDVAETSRPRRRDIQLEMLRFSASRTGIETFFANFSEVLPSMQT